MTKPAYTYPHRRCQCGEAAEGDCTCKNNGPWSDKPAQEPVERVARKREDRNEC